MIQSFTLKLKKKALNCLSITGNRKGNITGPLLYMLTMDQHIYILLFELSHQVFIFKMIFNKEKD